MVSPAGADRLVRSMYSDSLNDAGLVFRDPNAWVRAVSAIDDAGGASSVYDFAARLVDIANSVDVERARALPSTRLLGEDAVVLHRWASSSRAILTVNSTLFAALMDTDWGTTAIPGHMLRRLPFPDPAFVLPEPILAPHDSDELLERYDMFTVVGSRRGPRGSFSRCSSHDENAERLAILFSGRLCTPDGETVTQMASSLDSQLRKVTPVIGMTLLTPLRDMSMGERVSFALDDMGDSQQLGWNPQVVGDVTTPVSTRMVRSALSVLAYVCSHDPDVVPAPALPKRSAKGRRKRGGPLVSGPGNVSQVGFRVGAAIGAYTPSRPSEHPAGDGLRTVAPHMRRAHAAVRWAGPGRTQRRLVWIAPTAVNAHVSDTRTHVHTVR